MAQVDIRKLDFTLLVILASLLRTRKSTDTAAELNMTQSTVSHALARLRELTNDELFVRRPHGLDPTPRALALAPTLGALFALAREVLSAGSFDPAMAAGVLRIGAADYHCALMAAPLIARLGAEAPNLRLSFRPLLRKTAVDALLSGEIDIAIGRFSTLPAAVAVHELFEESYSIVARLDHKLIQTDPDIETYLAARHIVVSLDGELSGIVDQTLEAIGRQRTVVAAVPYFLAALATAAAGDAIVTLPSRLAKAYAARFGLGVFSPPIEVRAFKVSAVVPAAASRGGVSAWLAQEVLPTIVQEA
jgi:DNA-binding transcriptional LysR family regulator